MKILVLNCGSSSIKYKFFDMAQNQVLASGGVEKIGLTGSFLKHQRSDGKKARLEGEILEHQVGIEYIIGVLLSKKFGCLKSIDEIDAVGHRVVHGGEKFNGSILITEEVIQQIEECNDLAPLHNPPNLKGIYAMQNLLPDVPQVGVFDTAFHQTMKDHVYMYAIPYKLYKKYGVRRYGFHGTSHRYVSKRACEFLNLDYQKQRIITCHLGNGGSLAAIVNGKSVDTSMGFTPLEGLMMGTRSGDLDIGAVTYIMDKEKIGTKSANVLFNKQSGLLGVSGISSDSREIDNAAKEGNEKAALAMKMFRYRIKKYIGAYIAAMGGLDVLVFTGGIGENDASCRADIADNMNFLGIELNSEINGSFRSEEKLISSENSKVSVVVIPTDEELVIADDTLSIVKELK